MISETDLLSRFEKVKRQRQREGDWLVTCPAHADPNPSLHITLADDRWLLDCKAGCAFETVMGAIEPAIALVDLFAHRKGKGSNGNGRREVVATYDYVDEGGQLLFQVVRYRPKGFSQRRPDGSGGWIWKLGDTPRVLYRLPQILEAVAQGRTIHIVEGEKDVHAIESAGGVATCNPMGAAKWKDHHSAILSGATVVIVADRDDEGRAHAERVATSLAGVAGSVAILEPADGKDACDHLAAGLTLDDFRPACATEAPGTAELLATVGGFIRRFVVLPGSAEHLAIVLFVLHTWAFDAAYATPYIVVESPEKQSGKTRLLEVLELICRSTVKVASITAAGLFQTIGNGHPTLLIDEADAVFAGNSERNEDLRGVLNAGNAPGSKVIRGGKDGTPVSHDVYCPKVIAGIATGKLPDTIRDRAVVVPMDRKLRSERVERLRRRRLHADLDSLRGQLDAWAAEHHDHLAGYDLADPLERISDRLEEAWEPLVAIADLAGGDWPAAARAAAEALAGEGHESAPASHTLLVALRDVFGDNAVLPTHGILVALNMKGDLPFGAWSDGRGITARELGKLLGRYRIRPRTVRLPDGSTAKGYQRKSFEGAWSRYGGGFADTSVTTASHRQKTGVADPSQDPDVTGAGGAANPHEHWDVTDVSARGPDNSPDARGAVPATPEEEARIERLGRLEAPDRQ